MTWAKPFNRAEPPPEAEPKRSAEDLRLAFITTIQTAQGQELDILGQMLNLMRDGDMPDSIFRSQVLTLAHRMPSALDLSCDPRSAETATGEALDHHAGMQGLIRRTGENDEQLRLRVQLEVYRTLLGNALPPEDPVVTAMRKAAQVQQEEEIKQLHAQLRHTEELKQFNLVEDPDVTKPIKSKMTLEKLSEALKKFSL